MNINTEHLPEKTAVLFEKFAGMPFMKRFTLVGGTALSLQIGHRQSEDLDFIFDGEKIPATAIKRALSKMFPAFRLIREDKNYQVDFLIDGVKVTFFSTGAIMVPFIVKAYSFVHQHVNIATIEILSVLKMATIAQRNTIRHYYDLYYIAKHLIPLHDIIAQSKKMLPNLAAITYTETIIYTTDIVETSIENHLNPSEVVSKEEIAAFFIHQLKQMKG